MARLPQSIASLTGAGPFVCVVRVDDPAARRGLDDASARALVESALRAADIPCIPVGGGSGGARADAPVLAVAVGIDAEAGGRRVCVVEVDFWQSVRLERSIGKPDDGPLFAVTWSVERFVNAPAKTAGDAAEAVLTELLAAFAEDWRAANPPQAGG